MNMDEPVTCGEAALRLGISPPTLRKRIRRGELEVFEDPLNDRKRLIRVTDLEPLRQPRPVRREEFGRVPPNAERQRVGLAGVPGHPTSGCPQSHRWCNRPWQDTRILQGGRTSVQTGPPLPVQNEVFIMSLQERVYHAPVPSASAGNAHSEPDLAQISTETLRDMIRLRCLGEVSQDRIAAAGVPHLNDLTIELMRRDADPQRFRAAPPRAAARPGC